MSEANKPHYDALDGLRGVASIIVAINHSYLVLAIPAIAGLWNQNLLSPATLQERLHQLMTLFGNGGFAVSFFFVMSGFLSGESFGRVLSGRLPIFSYYLKRLFRLYPLYFAIITLSSIYLGFFFRYQIFPQASSWYHWWHQFPMDFPEYLRNISFLHVYIGGVTWTMKVEIVAMIFMPILYFVSRRSKILLDPLIIATLIILGQRQALAPEFQYFYMFYLGLIIPRWSSIFQSLKKAPFITYSLSIILIILGFYLRYIAGPFRGGLVESFVAFFLISTILFADNPLSKSLTSRVLLFLGKISYSIYLIHFLVLYTMARFMFTYLSFIPLNDYYLLVHTILLILSGAITIPIAMFTQRWIETPPSIYGSKLVKKIQGLQNANH